MITSSKKIIKSSIEFYGLRLKLRGTARTHVRVAFGGLIFSALLGLICYLELAIIVN